MRRTQGFTLIELMIVIAIIAIIASISIPALVRSRVQANQASAVGHLHVISAAQTTYFASEHRYGSFDDLTTAVPEFLDSGWVQGRIKAGYTFNLENISDTIFVCYADPVSVGSSGENFFRVDQTGAIRFSSTGRPDETAEVVGQPTNP